ncbi:hypothetical protein GCM10010156_26950 [Planobispora rosea]|uniref:Uncharacterized protein n=1 Tax=Planobispora rosea TaxID=35762 RepID=A0A8J3S040_PLARO|nr:hypothetical protein [Planobispora rosea]GGS66688.1 hypothetical protein GCM10010156_26950 [Planobispora rosea]GIH85057.1 hypothetical protein Pro02_34650 [Planobispora rosea]
MLARTGSKALLAAGVTALAVLTAGCGGGDGGDGDTPDVVETTGAPGVENDGETDNDGDGD